jgi:putative DNA primase/helicase
MSDDNVIPLRAGLIGADQLGRQAPVLVVEGAAAQQHAARLFPDYVCIALSGDIEGADFSGLADRLVTIWPHASDEGRQRAKSIAHKIVEAKATTVRVAKTDELPPNWNFDVVPQGINLRGLVQSATGIEDAEEIARLAQLDPLNFDREKKAASKRLGVGIGALELAVKVERRRQQEAATAAAVAAPVPIEPWKEPVSGADWLTHMAKHVRRFIAVKQELAHAVALWVLATHGLEAFNIFPRLLATSYAPEAGKTTLLRLIASVVPRPSIHDEATAASIYRTIDPNEPRCYLFDEMDNLRERQYQKLRKVLNSGFQRGGYFTVIERGDERQFPTFAPAGIFMIGEPHPAVASRCIWLRMKRRRPDETIEPFDAADPAIAAESSILARQATRWAQDNVAALKALPRPATTLISRPSDIWLPLLKCAALAAGEWPERAEKAISELEAHRGEGAPYDDLARDITAFLAKTKKSRVSADELATWLIERGNPRWGFERLTKNLLAYKLRPLGITPKPMRFSSTQVGQGYEVADFADFIARHAPPRLPPRRKK